MSDSICLEDISFVEKTCRACSRFDPNDSIQFHPIFNGDGTDEPSVEVAQVFYEFILWNLSIKCNDGLPQQMCSECLEKFTNVKLFREEVIDSQRLLTSYLQPGTSGSDSSRNATITIETLPMSLDENDRLGYVSPSKLIEYVGSDEERDCQTQSLSHDKAEIDFFEENESDFLFNHPNQIERNDLLDFKADKTETMDFNAACNMNFEEDSTKDNDKQIEQQTSSDKTKCNICQKIFRSEFHLIRHQKVFHIRRDLSCSICGKMLKNINQRSFDYHLKSHYNRKYKCSYCEKSFMQKVHLINHERTHTKERPFDCTMCGKSFRQKVSLSEHMLTHEDSHPFKCNICAKGFTHRSGLRIHLRLHDNTKLYQCEICGHDFNQKGHLTMHMMSHTSENPFRCEFCSRAFRKAYQLGNHMHSEHFDILDSIGKGNFHCAQCGQALTSIMHFIRHKKTHESNEHKFLCPKCGAGFKREAHLNVHMDTEHKKKKPFNCIYCNKSFAQLSNLNVHLKTHEDSKQHKCSFCDKSFTLRKTLVMHEAVHTGEKRFKCNFCDESFVYRQTLGAHIMNHFRDENEEEYTIKEEVLGEDDFLCYDDDFDLKDEFELDAYKLLLD